MLEKRRVSLKNKQTNKQTNKKTEHKESLQDLGRGGLRPSHEQILSEAEIFRSFTEQLFDLSKMKNKLNFVI